MKAGRTNVGRMKVGVLISGRGSNMVALAEACAAADFPAEIGLVLSNEPDAGGLARAAGFGIPTAVINHRAYDDRPSFEAAITDRLEQDGIKLICLAGFMRLLTAGVVGHWRNRMINIHPSLLPSFKGLETHERALAEGVRLAGCTVHFVRPAMDEGPIIMQAAVPVLPADTPEHLAARVLEQEHRLYPAALRLVASGAAAVVGEHVQLEGVRAPAEPLINPVID